MPVPTGSPEIVLPLDVFPPHVLPPHDERLGVGWFCTDVLPPQSLETKDLIAMANKEAKEKAKEDQQMGTPTQYRLVSNQVRYCAQKSKDHKQPKKSKEPNVIKDTKETKTQKKPNVIKDPKETKPRRQRPTKKEQDQAAVMKFLISPEYTSILKAHIHVALDKKQKSDKVDKLYKKAQKLMHEFSLLCDGDTEACTEEADCLMEYMGKMTQLQLKRMGRKTEAAHMQECNDAFARIKHAPLRDGAC